MESVDAWFYYYGARYYNPRESVWLNADPLSGYNPIMEVEHYIDGQHNGGVYNSFNHNTYGYCYQNPVLYVDPNGKQSEFHDEYLSPAELTGSFINGVRASFSNLVVRGVSLFTKEEITPRYVVSGSGKLILVADMPAESTKEKIVNSLGDGATIGFALLGGPQGALYAKTGKAELSLIVHAAKNKFIKAANGLFSASSYRRNLQILTGKIGKGFDAHHTLPKSKEFADFFKKLGIDVNDPTNLIWRGQTVHRKNAQKHLQAWREWISRNPNATKEQVMKQRDIIEKKVYGNTQGSTPAN